MNARDAIEKVYFTRKRDYDGDLIKAQLEMDFKNACGESVEEIINSLVGQKLITKSNVHSS